MKARQLIDGVEYNREEEFAVASYRDTCAALQLFGFRVDIEKRKRGYAYRHGDLLIEVVRIDGLTGCFVEIERLASDSVGGEERAAIRAQLLRTLGALAIDERAIEPRRYIDLLREAG